MVRTVRQYYGATPCDQIGGATSLQARMFVHAHCHAVGACIDYAIGIENRPIEAGVTENRRPGVIYNCCADIRKRQRVNLP